MEDKNKDVIDVSGIAKILLSKKKAFFIVWAIVFALSCLWVLPKPRYYKCEVELAPEGAVDDASGIASVASSFGINFGNMSNNDAIYPALYPDLFESTEFIVGLFDVPVVTDDESIKTDYYTYMKKHQKQNWLTAPFYKLKNNIAKMFSNDKSESASTGSKAINAFKLNKKDFALVQKIKGKIQCSVDKKTDVISITVTDQDRQVCALLADSIKGRLQDFIIKYRTGKTKKDVAYYKHLSDSAKVEYENALMAYGTYTDSHRSLVEDTYIELGQKLKNEVDLKLNAYNTINTQYISMRAKLQERTPSFTTLKSATVPQKPAGPKRMIFVIGMLLLSTLVLSAYYARKEIFMVK